MLTRLFFVLIVLTAQAAQAGPLAVTCEAQGSAPAVSAVVVRDPTGATDPYALTLVTCRDIVGGDFVCPCATRKPKPLSCLVAVVTPAEVDEPSPWYVACGYTDREHAKPALGPWRAVRP